VSPRDLIVVRSGLPLPVPSAGETIVSDDEVRAWVRRGGVLRRIRRFRAARLVTERLSTSGRPMLLWPLRLMARQCYVADSQGNTREVTVALLLRWTAQLAAEAFSRRRLLAAFEQEVEALAKTGAGGRVLEYDTAAPLLYLRTDLSFAVRAGGSVGHIAGVFNEIARRGPPPLLLTTSPVPTLDPESEVHVVAVPEAYWNFRELPTLLLNDVFCDTALDVLQKRRISCVYQRYSLNNFAGLRLSRQLRVPLVLEYNGSEVWMSRHWGRPLKYEALADRVERLNVTMADLVVVVSGAMFDELVSRGVPAGRILVNPNGADPDRYAPAIDGTLVRQRYDLEGKIVIGFMATFQAWHGADVLARAAVELMRDHGEYRDSVRLLLIGDGPRLPAARRLIDEAGLSDVVRLTGLVAQEDGPAHLAACDLLVSPHVPNPDGSPFFGSPTKLFEYMAMGKAIVASNLDQIGEVLRHRETAWLVPPGEPGALACAMRVLVEDGGLRRALGAAARRDMLAHYTWRAHVQRTLDALAARVRTTVS
jgi:glycosyltransferase involved in cell wall biosynthesis